MALSNIFALVFSTASLANGISECLQHLAFLATPKSNEHGALDAFQHYLPTLVSLNAQYHGATHIALWISSAWSLWTERSTRASIAIVVLGEICTIGIAGWVLEAVTKVNQAKTTEEVEGGLRLLLRRQVLRYTFTQAPSVVACIYAVSST